MSDVRPRMTNVFEQLGLASTEAAITEFIASHQLTADTYIVDAAFWSDSQRQFLQENISDDGEWAIVVDQLNEALHENSVQA